jgi:hypothetical protein
VFDPLQREEGPIVENHKSLPGSRYRTGIEVVIVAAHVDYPQLVLGHSQGAGEVRGMGSGIQDDPIGPSAGDLVQQEGQPAQKRIRRKPASIKAQDIVGRYVSIEEYGAWK